MYLNHGTDRFAVKLTCLDNNTFSAEFYSVKETTDKNKPGREQLHFTKVGDTCAVHMMEKDGIFLVAEIADTMFRNNVRTIGNKVHVFGQVCWVCSNVLTARGD